jgi:predicted TIM-barrel fold metal-dependent hydrolase
MIDEWCAGSDGHLIPLCLIPLWDVDLAVEEVRRNAERGARAVCFSEIPTHLGLPSIHTGFWDPFFAACADTGTVVNLHIGSSGASPATSDDAPPDVVGVLFFAYAIYAAVDWLYSGVPVRHPDIRICLSEGGIGWVAGLLDRLDHMLSYHDMYGTWQDELTPAEVLQRNFWFCAVEDPSSFAQRHRIGVDHILLEADYPHCDSTWPRTQQVIEQEIGDLPAEDVRKITWENAARLYRHPLPERRLP